MTQNKSKMPSTNCSIKVMSLDEFKLNLEFHHISTFERDAWVKKEYKKYLENLKNSTNWFTNFSLNKLAIPTQGARIRNYRPNPKKTASYITKTRNCKIILVKNSHKKVLIYKA